MPDRGSPTTQGSRVRATVSRFWLCIWFMVAACAANAQQIQFAEPVQLNVAGSTAGFDAYGRRFSLTLTDNDRVLTKLSAQRKQALKRFRLLRGTLEGHSGYWAGPTETARGVE